MFAESKKATVLMIALLCFSVTLMSSTATVDSYSLSEAAERMVIAGGPCSDFLNGFTLGMGVASFFGCVWCPGAALASKVVERLAC